MQRLLRLVAKRLVLTIYKLLVCILPIKPNLIMFESSVGRNYSGNPKYIYEHIVKSGLDHQFECVWIVEDTRLGIPGRRKVAKRLGILYFYYMAIARMWIFDSRQPEYLIKRQGCTYIQTWHGTPLKKIALDLEFLNMGGEKDVDKYKQVFLKEVNRWDYLLSQNKYSTEIFRRAFAFERTILEIGYPRNDILARRNTEEDRIKLKEKLGLPLNMKIILYAPTWRDDMYYTSSRFKFDHQLDFDVLYKRLKDRYVIILKTHYLVDDHLEYNHLNGFIYTHLSNHDIQELYLVSDLLITDYSSVMFDFSLLRKPMIFYAYDIEKYGRTLRGFYFDLAKEAPGPVVKNQNQLIEAIEQIEYVESIQKYEVRYDRFRERYNHCDNGKASEKVVELIIKLMDSESTVPGTVQT